MLGFVKFLKGYYLLLISAKKKVARIGYHDIYQVKDMKMVPLFRSSHVTQHNSDEAHYVDLFKQIKISEGFYFSYTYDMTRTLQSNALQRNARQDNEDAPLVRELGEHEPFASHFLWNKYLIKDFYACLIKKRWVMPVIYGFVTQKNFKCDTKPCSIVLISRRSRRYAGTRYLKRGINEHGNVANFVEVEQVCYIDDMQFDRRP